jgi:hypothetical protein
MMVHFSPASRTFHLFGHLSSSVPQFAFFFARCPTREYFRGRGAEFVTSIPALSEACPRGEYKKIQPDSLSVEAILHIRKVHVPENRDQSHFTHYGKYILDHARPTEWASRDANNSDSLVNVFLQAAVSE